VEYVTTARDGHWRHLPIIPVTSIPALLAGLAERAECGSVYYDHHEGWVYLRGGSSKRKKISRIP
jgi:hypothetical protein